MNEAREALVTIQRHPHHAKLGTMLRAIARVGKRSMFVRVLGVLGNVCPDCPVRVECEAASLALADLETAKLGGP
jgi:hypothetical protein